VSADAIKQRRAAAVKVLEMAAMRFRGVLLQWRDSEMAEAVFQALASRECKALEAELTFLLPLPENSATSSTQYRLAAILFTDIVDYTKLMTINEPTTIADVRACETMQREIVARHAGKYIKSTGDGTKSEFASAVCALRAAIEIHCEVSAMNRSKPRDRQIALRAGMAVGDVQGSDDGDVHSTCANIAARLLPLADPGTICLPASVHEDLAAKVSVKFKPLGLKTLKGFSRPIRVIQLDPETTSAEDLGRVAVRPALEDLFGQRPWRQPPHRHVLGPKGVDDAGCARHGHRGTGKQADRRYQGRPEGERRYAGIDMSGTCPARSGE